LFQELFEQIVMRCVEAGLVKGKHMSVDGSFIQANADHHNRVPPEQLAEVASVNRTVREYLVELERVSTTICFEWMGGAPGPSNVEIVDYH